MIICPAFTTQQHEYTFTPIANPGQCNLSDPSPQGLIGSDSRGQLDIYSFELPAPLRASPVSYVKARVTDALSRKPMAAAVELIRLSDGQMLTRSVSDPKTGEFLIVLPTGQDYLLNVIRKVTPR